MDVVLLARIQFALTVMFHFLFPPLTIGLALLIAITETLRWRTGREVFDRMSVFWTKVFAVTFVVGVATGIVMEFEFGTNWSRYSRFVGDVFGAPLAAEGVFAFFLESGFVGVMLFGRHRVSSIVRWMAAVLVAVGSTLSAFWIIVANSWMQTPAGFEIQGGRAVLTDFWAAALNPSTLPRFLHTISSAWVASAFLMTGVAAWYLLRGRHRSVARMSIRIGLIVAVLGSVLMVATGDNHARQVANTQPAKFAAMQGLFTTTSGAPLTIWALPPAQDASATVDGPAIVVTRMLSFMTYGSFDAPVTGLAAFPPADWPPVTAAFLTYHNMVLIGFLMVFVMALGLWFLWRGSIESRRGWLRLAVAAIPLPMIAIQLGWATAEIGRQPWIVYGQMRTADGTSPSVGAPELVASIVLFGALYTVLGGLWLYLLRREVALGPDADPLGELPPIPATGAVPALRPAVDPSAGGQ